MNGKVSHWPHKERMNMNKMDTVKCEALKYFPYIASEQKNKWAECVRAIDKGNIYVFSVLNQTFDLDQVIGYL